jgi:cysteine desulfurase family protein (TIGR01976 family)
MHANHGWLGQVRAPATGVPSTSPLNARELRTVRGVSNPGSMDANRVRVRHRDRARRRSGGPLSTTAFDVANVRKRFSALDRPLAFFDAPGGTQCPDEVITAIASYLRDTNANVGGRFETSGRTDELVERAHEGAAEFLGCTPDEVAFGQSMTALNFLLTRAFARTLKPGDEVLVTKLDHDANISPWLEIAHDLGIVVRFAELTDELEVDYDHLASLVSERTRVVGFPVAANSVGTVVDVRRVVEIAHSVGALAWADAVHYATHGPIDVTAWGVDVLICSPYKFFGPHMGLAYGRRELLESWRPYKVRPAADHPVGHRFELGTSQHELLAGFLACVDYVESIGWEAIQTHEHSLGQRLLDGLPKGVALYGPNCMDRRVPTFCFNLPERPPKEVATILAERDVAVWHGDYYAVETMRHLRLDDGAVRAGIVHYNTEGEVDRLLSVLNELVLP